MFAHFPQIRTSFVFLARMTLCIKVCENLHGECISFRHCVFFQKFDTFFGGIVYNGRLVHFGGIYFSIESEEVRGFGDWERRFIVKYWGDVCVELVVWDDFIDFGLLLWLEIEFWRMVGFLFDDFALNSFQFVDVEVLVDADAFLSVPLFEFLVLVVVSDQLIYDDILSTLGLFDFGLEFSEGSLPDLEVFGGLASWVEGYLFGHRLFLLRLNLLLNWADQLLLMHRHYRPLIPDQLFRLVKRRNPVLLTNLFLQLGFLHPIQFKLYASKLNHNLFSWQNDC